MRLGHRMAEEVERSWGILKILEKSPCLLRPSFGMESDPSGQL